MATTSLASDEVAIPGRRALGPTRLGDLLELAKPRLTAMVVVTAGVGFILGSGPGLTLGALGRLVAAVTGIALVSAAASALNQWWEIRWDRRMRRTRERPLAAARISARGALIYSALTCAGGLFLLIRFTHPLAALLAFTTLVTYLLVYTPLKRKLTLNTLVGAVPGALPPLIGWAAATGGLAPEAWILFGILFAWQVPHFLAIAWLHRSDYSRGGFQMLPVIDPSGERTARMVTLYSLSMVPVSLAPALAGLSGWIYLIAALLLGSGFFLCALLFERRPTRATARRLYLASLAYLPLLFTVMIVDPTVPRPLFP